MESLQKIVRMKQRLKRPISRSTLEVLPGVNVGIGFYSFVRKALPPRALNINKRTNEVVERTVSVVRTVSILMHSIILWHHMLRTDNKII